MRITKIIISSLLAVVVLLVTISSIFPSFEYTNNVTIHSSKEVCWETMTNPATLHRWISGLETYKLISGEHLKPGGTYSMTIVEGDEKMEMIQRIEDVKPPSEIRYFLTNDVLTSDYTYSLNEAGGTTTLQAHYRITGNSVFWSAILRLSKGVIRSQSQTDLDRLKKMIESNK